MYLIEHWTSQSHATPVVGGYAKFFPAVVDSSGYLMFSNRGFRLLVASYSRSTVLLRMVSDKGCGYITLMTPVINPFPRH